MKPPLPTDAELAVLTALWSNGPSRVRSVLEAMGKGVGYTTVLKVLQIMHRKGLVYRQQEGSGHIYVAAETREVTEQRLVARLVDQVFEGSAYRMVMAALGPEASSRGELKKLRKAIKKEESAR